jgi:hypothetical protein
MSPVDRVVLAFVSTRGSLYQFAGAVNRLFEMAESSRVRFDQRCCPHQHIWRSRLRIVETLRAAYLLALYWVDHRAVTPLKLET